MNIRNATSVDVPAIVALFQQTILEATAHHYSNQQRQVWAARGTNITRWEERIAIQHFLLAEQQDQLVGFGSITSEGYLDVLYVHHAYQDKGIATRLLTALETWAEGRGLTKIIADASITARSFFERRGFSTVKEQQNLVEHEVLVNYRMEKML